MIEQQIAAMTQLIQVTTYIFLTRNTQTIIAIAEETKLINRNLSVLTNFL